MDLTDKMQLKVALDELSAATGVTVPADVLAAYLAGQAPHSVGYEKLVGPQGNVGALAKYFLVAQSYLVQPSVDHFYDIFRAGRVIPLLRRLHLAVRALADARVPGSEMRLRRLVAASELDDLDAVLFELVVAAAYGEAAGFERVEFIPEQPPAKTPELVVHLPAGDTFVECKRFDRMTDAHVTLRNEVRDLSNVVLRALREQGTPAVVEVTFDGRPANARGEELAAAALRSLRAAGTLETIHGASVVARRLTMKPLANLALFPSPKYMHDAYGYSPERWHGIVPAMLAKRAGPSFLDEVDWEAAVVWRIEDDDVLWSIKRLGFARIFEGLEQLATAGRRTVLHVWAERGAEHGHRETQLAKLVDTLEQRSKDQFAWIIVNETVGDVSVGGRFDFQEHATPIAGREATRAGPLVTTVFIGSEDIRGIGKWGVGLSLPPIDEESGED